MSDGTAVAIVTAIVTCIASIATNVLTFLTLWIKLKYGVDKAETAVSNTEAISKKTDSVLTKVDDNTKITQAAAEEASGAKEVTQSINNKLNGGIDKAINDAIGPIQNMISEHAEKISELNKYVHQRNHEILTALQTQSNKLESILILIKGQNEVSPH